MKLLVFCHEFPPVGGGASNALYHLGREWVKLGVAVTVVTSHHGDLPETENVEGIQVQRLRVGRRYLFRGYTHEMLKFTALANRLSNSLFRKIKPDLSVAFMTLPAGAIAYRLFRKFKLPYVTELRGADVPGFNPQSLGLHHFLMGPFVKKIWAHSTSVIANSEGLREMAARFCPGQKISVLPNGVDYEKFKPLEARPAEGETLKLLFAGRFEETQKNITMLLDALADFPKGQLTLVGDGKEKNLLIKESKKRTLSARVRFTGWLKEKELIEAYQEADIFVSASKWEGMPNSVLEAMSCALPVLLSDIPGHRELVEDGKNGFLFGQADLGELSKRLRELAANAALRGAMGKRSRALILEKHNWQSLAKAHLAAWGINLTG